jgi:hypothetical protein
LTKVRAASWKDGELDEKDRHLADAVAYGTLTCTTGDIQRYGFIAKEKWYPSDSINIAGQLLATG